MGFMGALCASFAGGANMSVTTEEAERLAIILNRLDMDRNAAALRALAAERDALRAENEKLKAGGCARDHGLVMHLDAGDAASYPGSGTTWTDLSRKGTTQFCAEAVALKAENANLQDDLASAERERAHQQGRADRNAAEYAREQKKREQLQAENARLREAFQKYFGQSEATNIRALPGETQ
jgi:hypothetical protein